MSYIIFIDNQKKWALEIDPFKDFLIANYKGVNFIEITDKSRPYSYEWNIQNPKLEGFLHRDKDSIHIDGSLEDCVDFVISIRKMIPEKEQVLFFDSSYNYNATINLKTTKEDLESIFV
jgi:hypothetical protein